MTPIRRALAAISRFVRVRIFRRPEPPIVERPPDGAIVFPELPSSRALEEYGSGTQAVAISTLPRPPISDLIPLRPASCLYEVTFQPRPYWLFDSIHLTAICGSALRVIAFHEDVSHCIFQVTVTPIPMQLDHAMLLGLHRARAEAPVTLRIESRVTFEVYELRATYLRPDFRREQASDGTMMLVFNDPFYKPIAESEFGLLPSAPHHRKIYGPGADVGY